MYSKQELLSIFIDSFIDLEKKTKATLYTYLKGQDNSKAFLLAHKDRLEKEIGKDAFELVISSLNNTYINAILKELEEKEITVLTRDSEDFPKELKEVPVPPLCLYLKGNKQLLKKRRITVTGSRKNQQVYLKECENFVVTLCDTDVVIVSGFSVGAEETAIKESLKTGNVIGVVFGGFDNVYPPKNKDLVNKVANNGLIVSEFPPSFKARRFDFCVMPRIPVALGECLLVVSGNLNSGTRHSVEYADGLSKQIFAFPYPINTAYGEGNNYYIKTGIARLTDNVKDLFELLKIESKIKTAADKLSEDERQVYDIIKDGDVHIEKIMIISGKTMPQLMPILMLLEMKKFIVKNSGNVYSACGK